MNAYTFLEELKNKEEYLKCKKDELHRLEMLEMDTSAPLRPDPVQSSGNKDKLGSLIANRIDFEKEVVMQAESAYLTYRNEVIDILEKVKAINFQQYRTLHLKYVDYLELGDVSKEMRYSYSRTKVFHIEGVKNVQKILDFSKVNT